MALKTLFNPSLQQQLASHETGPRCGLGCAGRGCAGKAIESWSSHASYNAGDKTLSFAAVVEWYAGGGPRSSRGSGFRTVDGAGEGDACLATKA